MRRRNPSDPVTSFLKWGGLLVAGYAGHRVLKRVEEAHTFGVPMNLAFKYFFEPISITAGRVTSKYIDGKGKPVTVEYIPPGT